jgi:protein-tyrosine-phosphatase
MTPQPVDARVVKFMAAKAVDISKQSSKSLEQVPEWQHYQVIVCFGGKVRDAISPPASGKTVFFNWPVKDPLLETGSAAATNAAFEEAYQSLNAHIRELLGAILQEPQNTSKP